VIGTGNKFRVISEFSVVCGTDIEDVEKHMPGFLRVCMRCVSFCLQCFDTDSWASGGTSGL